MHKSLIHTINTRRSLRNPQILELSGIGNKTVLDKIGIPVKLEVPGIGGNVQEHANVILSYGEI